MTSAMQQLAPRSWACRVCCTARSRASERAADIGVMRARARRYGRRSSAADRPRADARRDALA
eukprot:1208003-Pleurochrysis_carterae.AAC.1